MAQLSLDLGPGDVHVPGVVSPAKGKASVPSSGRRKARMKAARARRLALDLARRGLAAGSGGKAIHIRMTSPDGSHTTIRHTLSAVPDGAPAYYLQRTGHLLGSFVRLDKGAALAEPEAPADSDPERRVWVNVARAGTWAGHPQGAFRFDSQIFDALVRNFRTSGVRRLQWDFNHASAMPANSGSIPVTGTPAQGWIYDLRHDGQNLYALTEWLPLARQYIENDQYDSASVVVAWDSRDRATNAKIGPVLRSVALTNEAFITNLHPLAADANGASSGSGQRGIMQLIEVAQGPETQALSAKYSCHSFLGMLPRLKQTFGLHELATADQVRTALDNYRAHLDATEGDGLGTHEGIALESYSLALREMVNAHAGMDWYAILDIIDELLDAYLYQHGLPDFEESHGPIPGGPVDNNTVATAASVQGVSAMPESVEVQVAAATAPVTEKPTVAVVEPEAAVTAASASGTTSEASLPSPDVARLTLENAELRARIAAFDERLAALSTAQAESHESALSAEVDAAMVTYGQTKGLVDSMRPHLLSMLRSAPDAFHAMYPPVAPEQRHLLSNLTGGGASNPQHPGARVEADTATEIKDPAADPAVEQPGQVTMLSYGQLVESLRRDHKLTHSAAMVRAENIIKARAAH